MDNLDKILDSVQEEEQKALDEQRAAEAEDRRKHEAANRRDEAKSRVEQAIRENNLQKLTQALDEGQQKGDLPKDYLQTLPEKWWITDNIQSAEVADFLLSQIDTKTKKGTEFAENVIHNVILYGNQPLKDTIEMAKKYNISMRKTLNYPLKNVVLKCLEAGADPQDFDFERGVRIYYNHKNGYTRSSQYSDVEVDPNPERAAEQKEILKAVLQAGYKIDVEKLRTSTKEEDKIVYKFLGEIAREREAERKFATLSAEDKKLAEEMTKEDVDITAYDIEKIRDMLGDKMMKQEVYDYMRLLPKENRGDFFNYYDELMGKSHQAAENGTLAADDTLPKSLDEAEIKLVNRSDINDLLYNSKIFDMRPRCEEDIKNRLGTLFFDDLERGKSLGFDGYMDHYLEDYLGKRLLAEYVAEHLEEKMKAIETDEDWRKTKYLRNFLILDSKNSDERSSIDLKKALLEYRTSGTLAERRHKANLFKEALQSTSVKKKSSNSAFHKAVSKVSYTSASSLNKYQREVKNEEKSAAKFRQAVETKKSKTR